VLPWSGSGRASPSRYYRSSYWPLQIHIHTHTHSQATTQSLGIHQRWPSLIAYYPNQPTPETRAAAEAAAIVKSRTTTGWEELRRKMAGHAKCFLPDSLKLVEQMLELFCSSLLRG